MNNNISRFSDSENKIEIDCEFMINAKYMIKNKRIISDEEFILQSIAYDYTYFSSLSEKMRSDVEFILKAMKKNSNIIEYIHDNNVLLKLIKYKPEIYSDIYSYITDGREFTLNAIKTNVDVYHHIKNKYRYDEEMMLEVIKYNWKSISTMDYKLKINKNFILKAVKINGNVLSMIDSYRMNEELVEIACRQDITLLRYASEKLRNNNMFKLLIQFNYAKTKYWFNTTRISLIENTKYVDVYFKFDIY